MAIAYGRNDKLYRKGPNHLLYEYVPKNKGNKWKLMRNRKVRHIAASKDALWVLDYSSKIPYRYNEISKKFERKGSQKAWRLSVGLNGYIVMIGQKNKLYGWSESQNKWNYLNDNDVFTTAIGRQGRMYKVDTTGKLFQ